MNEKIILSNDVEISYRDTGQGDITLLFVHGSYIDQSYWDTQVDFFKSKYRVITMDLPGHGKSGKNREQWSIEGFGEDVVNVIKALNLKRVILIGHSLGGDINLVAAVNDPSPIIGFIGIDNFKAAATPLPESYQKQVETIKENLKKDFENTNEQYAKMVLLTPQTPAAIAHRVIKDYRAAYKPMGIPITAQVFEFYKKEQELLPQLNFKLILIDVDYMPTNEEPLKRYPAKGYKLFHIPGTCHYPMLENPDQLNQLLEQAIREIKQP
jgi:pimeloyl-ACP methyl ester carboxylesterase